MSSDPNRKIEGEVDRFDDIFHTYGDDADEREDANIDFDQFFTDFYKNDDDDDAPVPAPEPIQEEEEEEQRQLSQKLSQLSASNEIVKKRPATTPTTTATTKKLKFEDNIPKYLSSTDTVFEETMNRFVSNRITIEDLRQIAILEHKLKLTNLETTLWTTFLRSGTNKLKEDQPIPNREHITIWPEKLKAIICADPDMNLQGKKPNCDTCLNYVYKMLHQLRDRTMDYEKQLTERKQLFGNRLTSKMVEAIEIFIEHYGIASHRLLIESQIVIVNHDYLDRLFEFNFRHENPYQSQLTLFQNITQSKLDKEISKMEMDLLKQRVAHQQVSNIFDSLNIPVPSTLTTIEDQTIRQHLIYRYEQLVQRTKSELLILHIRAAEVKMEACAKNFDVDQKEFYQKQRTDFSEGKFTPTMMTIMEQRLKNIDERLKTLYDLKIRFFVKAPTVNKN